MFRVVVAFSKFDEEFVRSSRRKEGRTTVPEVQRSPSRRTVHADITRSIIELGHVALVAHARATVDHLRTTAERIYDREIRPASEEVGGRGH